MNMREPCNLEDDSLVNRIVIRAKALDCYAGLTGHDYIAARRLGKLVQASAQEPPQAPRE